MKWVLFVLVLTLSSGANSLNRSSEVRHDSEQQNPRAFAKYVSASLVATSILSKYV